MIAAGVAPAFAARAYSTPNSRVWVPTVEELLSAGVLTGAMPESSAVTALPEPPAATQLSPLLADEPSTVQSIKPQSRGSDSAPPSPASELTDDNSQNNLGIRFENGDGVPKDLVRAVYWYRKAAEQGNPTAQYNLGLMYEEGQGVPKNLSEAVAWFQKAAAAGDATQRLRWEGKRGIAAAQNRLGGLYERGEGVSIDIAVAKRFYRDAAERGLTEARENLDRLNRAAEEARDRQIQDERTRQAETRKANAGDAEAQYRLGLALEQESGHEQDGTRTAQTAAYWYRKAAESGHRSAQRNLGLMYEAGRGVPADAVFAYAWISLSAEGSDDPTAQQDRDRVAGSITPAQLAEGKRLASAWARLYGHGRK